MCTKTESVLSGLQSIIAESENVKRNAFSVAKWLREEISRIDADIDALKKRRDEYVLKARMLDGGKNAPTQQEKELSKTAQKTTKPVKSSKPVKPKYHKPTQAEIDAMTPECRARYEANVARCEQMRMAKQKKALTEKFAETKIS